MLQEYLKYNRYLRAIIRPIARRVGRFQLVDRNAAFERYRERVSGGTVIVSPDNIPGEFELSATSDLAARVILSGNYEPEVTRALAHLPLGPGMIVNVGANVGFYAVFFATALAGDRRVLAIEANPEAFALLGRNIRRNRLDERVTAIQACVGDSKGSVEFCVIAGMPEYSSIGRIVHPSVAQSRQVALQVEMAPLLSIVGNERTALIFVDTEGAEAKVFAGARDILMRDKPLLFFEGSNTLLRKFGSSTQTLEGQLRELGYVVRNGLCRRLPLQHPYEGEVLAVHRDRIGGVLT